MYVQRRTRVATNMNLKRVVGARARQRGRRDKPARRAFADAIINAMQYDVN